MALVPESLWRSRRAILHEELSSVRGLEPQFLSVILLQAVDDNDSRMTEFKHEFLRREIGERTDRRFLNPWEGSPLGPAPHLGSSMMGLSTA